MTSREVVFQQMYATYGTRIQAYCFRRLPAADANDAAADTFTVAWRRIDDAPEPDRHLPWLYGIARNTVWNINRSRRRSDRLRARLHGLRSDAITGPETEVMKRDTELRVNNALSKLRPGDQEIIRLRTWEELPNQEIAEILGLSVRAVESRLTRARRKLSRLLAELEEEPSRTHRFAPDLARPLAPEKGGER